MSDSSPIPERFKESGPVTEFLAVSLQFRIISSNSEIFRIIRHLPGWISLSMIILIYIVAVIGVAVLVLYNYVRIPSSLPKQLPAVPFYVNLLGLWSYMGQDEIYDRWMREPLEKHGAVKLWFAGKWCVLVTRPSFLSSMLRQENIYAKAGSRKKIPWTVMAHLVGHNIINSHADDWKHYTNIMKPGLQKNSFDTTLLLNKSRRFVDILLDMQHEKSILGKGGIRVNPMVQRFTVAMIGESFLDIDFGCLESPNQRIEQLQTIIKETIFKPLYLTFPALDRYPWLFPSRARAFAIMQEFDDLLYHLVINRPRKLERKEPVAAEDELVVHMMERALDEGRLTEKQFRDNLKILFLAAHEDPQLLLDSMFWQLGEDQAVQDKLRQEVLNTDIENPDKEILDKLPYLTAVIMELLRLYPPVAQMTNRVCLESSRLDDQIFLPKGTWVGWNALGVQSDVHVWGPTAREFIPERWGSTAEEIMSKFRRETVKGNFIAFNSHNRKCLGQGWALLEIKTVMFELVRRTKWKIDPDYKFKLTPIGILAPMGCKVIIEKI